MTKRLLHWPMVLSLGLSVGSSAYGQGPPRTAGWSASLAPVHQYETGLDEGGEFSVSRLYCRIDGRRPFGETGQAGLGLSYDVDDYDFSGESRLADGDPWERIQHLDVGASLLWDADPWQWAVRPSVGFAAEDGADTGDGVVYGGVVSATRAFSPSLTLGLGAGVFRRVEETRGYPFIAVVWRINERLTLSNPFRPGPAGPAGLELAWDLGGDWQIAGGGAYRSSRFRLNDDGAIPSGIGDTRGVPLFVRLSRSWGRRYTVDLWAGWVVAGRLEVEDVEGGLVASSDFDPAPLTALTLSARF